jgi:hypothetical protein
MKPLLVHRVPQDADGHDLPQGEGLKQRSVELLHYRARTLRHLLSLIPGVGAGTTRIPPAAMALLKFSGGVLLKEPVVIGLGVTAAAGLINPATGTTEAGSLHQFKPSDFRDSDLCQIIPLTETGERELCGSDIVEDIGPLWRHPWKHVKSWGNALTNPVRRSPFERASNSVITKTAHKFPWPISWGVGLFTNMRSNPFIGGGAGFAQRVIQNFEDRDFIEKGSSVHFHRRTSGFERELRDRQRDLLNQSLESEESQPEHDQRIPPQVVTTSVEALKALDSQHFPAPSTGTSPSHDGVAEGMGG